MPEKNESLENIKEAIATKTVRTGLRGGRQHRVNQTKISFVQRSPNDHAHDSGVESRAKSANVVKARDPARRDHWQMNRLGDFDHPRHIDTGLRSVARNIRHDCRTHAGRAKPISRVGYREVARLDPSFDCEHAFANV